MEMNLKNKDFIEHSSGLYVSSDGEIYVPSGSRGRKEHFTFGYNSGDGYLQVRRNRNHYYVHRLVAECWIPNPDSLPTVDHINRDKTDNRVENLRWASMTIQMINANHPKNNACSKKVLQYTIDGELVREWSSTSECGRNGYNFGNVAACCRGILKTYKGFMWRYED